MCVSYNLIAITQLQLLLDDAVSQYLPGDIFRSILMIDVRHMFTLINMQKIDDLLYNDLLKDRLCNIIPDGKETNVIFRYRALFKQVTRSILLNNSGYYMRIQFIKFSTKRIHWSFKSLTFFIIYT